MLYFVKGVKSRPFWRNLAVICTQHPHMLPMRKSIPRSSKQWALHKGLLTIANRRNLPYFLFIKSDQNYRATVKVGRREGIQRKRWDDNFRELTNQKFNKFPEGNEGHWELEKPGCKVICDALLTFTVKALMMMSLIMMMMDPDLITHPHTPYLAGYRRPRVCAAGDPVPVSDRQVPLDRRRTRVRRVPVRRLRGGSPWRSLSERPARGTVRDPVPRLLGARGSYGGSSRAQRRHRRGRCACVVMMKGGSAGSG